MILYIYNGYMQYSTETKRRRHALTMTMVTRSLLILALVALAVLPTVTADLSLSNASCNSPWTLSGFSSSCNGGDCSASGTITVADGGEFANEEVDITFSTMYMTVFSTKGNLCDMLDGTCESTGDFTFSQDLTLPDSINSSLISSILSMTSPTVTVNFGDITSCSAKVSAVQSGNSMSMVASSAVVGSLAVGALVYGLRRRRRVIQDESLKRTLTDFEMAPHVRSVQV